MEAGKRKGRKIRISKNKKKNWNKACDVSDIEDYLEETRFEERIGGPAYEKPDSELFIFQTSREDTLPEDTKPFSVPSKKGRRPLKCHSSIGNFSKVPPPIDPNKICRYSKRINNVISRAEDKRVKAYKKKPFTPPKPTNEKGQLFIKEFNVDLWEEKKEDPEAADLVKFHNFVTRKKIHKVPKHRYQKPSLLPSVEVPHPGASYNPSFEDHQDLLLQAVRIEEKKEKEKLHLKRVLTDMFPTKAEAPTQESILAEMSQGLFDKEEVEEEDSKYVYLSNNPPVTADNRCTRSRRRKQREQKEQARARAAEKLEKKRMNEFSRMKAIKSEIKAAEELTEVRHANHEEKINEKMYKPRVLSMYKYEPNDLEVNLTEELRGSLREIKTEGNILEDRYKSLQKRNIIEPRIRQKFKRKYKLKVIVKRNYKDTQ